MDERSDSVLRATTGKRGGKRGGDLCLGVFGSGEKGALEPLWQRARRIHATFLSLMALYCANVTPQQALSPQTFTSGTFDRPDIPTYIPQADTIEPERGWRRRSTSPTGSASRALFGALSRKQKSNKKDFERKVGW